MQHLTVMSPLSNMTDIELWQHKTELENRIETGEKYLESPRFQSGKTFKDIIDLEKGTQCYNKLLDEMAEVYVLLGINK